MARRGSAVAAVVLGGWAALYLPPLLAGRTLPARDIAATQLPWRTVWRQQVLAGRLPLWDHLSDQGRPLLANPNAMAAYPGTLLFLPFDPETAALLHIALHHLLLIVACAVLARRAGAGNPAAIVAAAATATSGVAWSTTTFLNTQASLVWAVLAVAFAVPAPRGAPALRSSAAGVALGLAFLAGEPVVAGLGALAWTAVVAATWRPFRARHVALAAGVALATAAPVLAPLAAVYGDTMRATLGAAPGSISADALAPRRLVELLLPNLLGPPLADGRGGFWAAASFPWQRYFPLVFVGATVLGTVPFARRWRRPTGIWWVLLGIGLGGAALLGAPAVASAVASVPGLSAVRYGIKLTVLAFIAMPPLVAAGYERLTAAPASLRRGVAASLLAAAAVVAVTAAVPGTVRSLLARLYPRSAAALAEVSATSLRRTIAADATALALPGAALLATGAAVPLAAATLVANVLAARDVLAFDDAARWRRPPVVAEGLGPGTTLASIADVADPKAPAGNPALGRFWASRAALVPQYGTRWGLGYVLTRGPDGLEPALQDLVAAETAHLDTESRARVAAALGASAVIAPTPLGGGASRRVDGVWLSELAAAPPVYLARRSIPCLGIPAAVQALADPSFRPGVDAVVTGAGGTATLATGAAVERSDDPARRRFAVRSDGAGLLVVQQTFMRCWRARLDGAPVAMEPVNGSQIGIRVPEGVHDIDLYVDPTPARLGLLGPLLALLALAATRRAAPSPAPPDASGAAARSTPATPPAP